MISNRVENQNKSFIGSVDNLNKAKTLAESSYKLKREKKESKSKKLNQNLIDVVIDFYVQKDS